MTDEVIKKDVRHPVHDSFEDLFPSCQLKVIIHNLRQDLSGVAAGSICCLSFQPLERFKFREPTGQQQEVKQPVPESLEKS